MEKGGFWKINVVIWSKREFANINHIYELKKKKRRLSIRQKYRYPPLGT